MQELSWKQRERDTRYLKAGKLCNAISFQVTLRLECASCQRLMLKFANSVTMRNFWLLILKPCFGLVERNRQNSTFRVPSNAKNLNYLGQRGRVGKTAEIAEIAPEGEVSTTKLGKQGVYNFFRLPSPAMQEFGPYFLRYRC